MVNRCCFCFEPVTTGALALGVVSAERSQDADAPRQTMWSHSACLSDRLAPGVPFDAQAFLD